jgi:hypothetical protein
MLQNTNPAVVYCLERAAECERLAAQVKHSQVKANYQRIARNWRSLSDQQQNIDRFERFLKKP